MKLLHQAEPTHSNFSVNGWTIQLSGPGWISNARPAVRLIVFLQGTPLELLYPDLVEHLYPEIFHNGEKKEDCAFAKPSHRAIALHFPATTSWHSNPKIWWGRKIPFATPYPLLSFQQEASFVKQWRGAQAALPPGVVVGGNPAAPAKLRKEAITLIYICKWSRELSAKLFKYPITIKLLGIHCKNSHNTVTNLVLMWMSAFHCSYFVLHHKIIYQ